MNKILITLFALAFLWQHSTAQNASVKGQITDDQNTPLISATVSIGKSGAVTDLEGMFEIQLPSGQYELSASYVGYQTKTEQLDLKPGEEIIVNVILSESLNLLETATVTSGKYEMALGEVTVSLDVIKPSLIENTNQTSLEGLLDKVPGVNMIGDQANIRGGSGFSYGAGSRVLLLVDDMPIYQADAGFPQWEDVPIENIEQIEVVKGAASALYGSSALNGIINVRTAYAKAEPETTFSPFYTAFSKPKNEDLAWWDGSETPYTTGFTLVHRRKIGKFDIVAGGRYHRNNSVQDSSFSRRGRFTLNTRYRITDRLSVGVNTNFNRSKGQSFLFWQDMNNLYRPGNALSSSDNLRYNIDPFLTYYDKKNNRHKILTRFFNVDNQTGSKEADQTNISQVYYGEYQYQRKMGNIGLVITSGLVYNGTRVRAPLYGDTTFTNNNLAAYVQLEKKFFDKLNISAGLRYEDNTQKSPEEIYYSNEIITVEGTVPNGKTHEAKPVVRLGASYELAKATFLRTSWGQGYRFPTIAEKFIFTQFGGLPIIPNLDLHSETGWTAELGIRQGFKISNFNGFFDASAFWMEYNDMMEFTFVLTEDFEAFFQSQNIGNTIIKGFEVSVNGRGNLFGLPTTLLAGYTYIDPKFKEFGLDEEKYPIGSQGNINATNSSNCSGGADSEDCVNILKYRYRHTAKFDMESKYKKLSFGVSAQYTSFMENIDAVFELLLFNQEGKSSQLREFRKTHNNGDLILGLRSSYTFNNNIKASLIANNVANREYASRPGKLDAPRNVTLRMDFNF
ncbi:MAG: TonB-dependent receptor [Saprospiraceae bacterium]